MDKELKRRAALAARETASGPSSRGDSENSQHLSRISALWDRIEAANQALPPELRLQRKADGTDMPASDVAPFQCWLMAHNGASLGFNGEGIRYVWPELNERRSNNFWIRWKADRGYWVIRRVGATLASMKMQERRFDESRIDYLLRCLVTGVRVTPRSIRKRRLWLF